MHLTGNSTPAWYELIRPLAVLPLIVVVLGLAAPFATTLLGWIAIAQIRRSTGRLYGLGLAVLDGLLYPLLVFDLLPLSLFLLLIRAHIGGRGTSEQSGVPGPAILLIGLVTLLALDILIVRWVWRAVNKPIAGMTPPVPAASSRRLPPDRPALAVVAISLATLAGVIGAADWLRMPGRPPIMVWPILIAAVLAVLLAIPARSSRAGKYAMVVGCLDVVVWLGMFMAYSKSVVQVPDRGARALS